MSYINKEWSVAPDPAAVFAVGGYHSRALNLAIECWAHQVQQAKLPSWERADWMALAALLDGVVIDSTWTPERLATAVEAGYVEAPYAGVTELADAYGVTRATIYAWMASQFWPLERGAALDRKTIDAYLTKQGKVPINTQPKAIRFNSTLASDILRLSYAELYAVLVAVRWYLDHRNNIGPRDKWWELDYRIGLAGAEK